MAIGKLTEEQIENIFKYVQEGERKKLNTNLGEIRIALKKCRRYGLGFSKYGLKSANENCNKKTEKIKEDYGVEFPDLQKQYEAMLPEINKYLEIKC